MNKVTPVSLGYPLSVFNKTLLSNNELSESKFNLLLWMFDLFSFSFVCISAYAYVFNFEIQGPLRECRSIRSGASGLPNYCAPLVRVPDVIGLLTVWWHNKPKPKI